MLNLVATHTIVPWNCILISIGCVVVYHYLDLYDWTAFQVGKKNRSVGATLMNQDSSRSHSIFSVTVEASARPTSGPDGAIHIRVGKLNLVSHFCFNGIRITRA